MAGFYLATTNDANNNLGERAWGLWANDDSTANAIRKFPANLHVGDVFTMDFDNNWIADDKSVGVAMQNRFGQSLFEFFFSGGGTNYYINDLDGVRPTGVPWTDLGLALSFELISSEMYRFKIGEVEFTGTLMTSAETAVKQTRIWNFSAGGGWEFNLYANNLVVDGVALESMEYSSERTITRGTPPTDPSTPDIMDVSGTQEWSILLPTSTPGRLYDVYYTSNLMHNVWAPMGLDVPGNGGPINLLITNYLNNMFYTTGSHPIQ